MARGVVAATADEYLDAVQPDQGEALRRLRAVIEATEPDAVAGIGYGIIVFRLFDRGLVGISAAANHCSLHLMSPAAAAVLKDSISEGRWSGVTLQFQPDAPLSETVIRQVVEYRARENASLARR